MTRNHGSQSPSRRLRAERVLHRTPRLDLIIKYLYAVHASSPDEEKTFYQNLYADHIRAFNGFYEEQPLKRSREDFLTAFDALLSSMADHGYLTSCPRIQVSAADFLIDGAHRLAAAAALGLELDVEVTDQKAPYDDLFFRNRGLPEWIVIEAIRRWTSLNRSARLVLVFPAAASLQDEHVVQVLGQAGVIFASAQWRVGYNSLVNIKRLAYPVDSNPWIGTRENSFKGAQDHALKSAGPGSLRVYVIHSEDADALIEAKAELRKRVGIGNFSIHTSDSHQETVSLSNVLFSEEGVRFLHLRGALRETREFDYSIDAFRDEVQSLGMEPESVLVAGSATVGALALRRPRDLDFLTVDSRTHSRTLGVSTAENHIDIEDAYGTSRAALVLDPRNSFWYRGVKVLGVARFVQMKSRRREWPKDYRDILKVAINTLASVGDRLH